MTTKAQTVERLLQVVRVLRELPKGKRFDLGRWYKCGSTACACGWAASDPWFRRRGLHLRKYLEEDFLGEHNTHGPVFQEYTEFTAIDQFFGLSSDETEFLFNEEAYKRGSRRDVIRRIEKFVRDNLA